MRLFSFLFTAALVSNTALVSIFAQSVSSGPDRISANSLVCESIDLYRETLKSTVSSQGLPSGCFITNQPLEVSYLMSFSDGVSLLRLISSDAKSVYSSQDDVELSELRGLIESNSDKLDEFDVIYGGSIICPSRDAFYTASRRASDRPLPRGCERLTIGPIVADYLYTLDEDIASASLPDDDGRVVFTSERSMRLGTAGLLAKENFERRTLEAAYSSSISEGSIVCIARSLVPAIDATLENSVPSGCEQLSGPLEMVKLLVSYRDGIASASLADGRVRFTHRENILTGGDSENPNQQTSEQPSVISAGKLIIDVISGIDYSGQVLVITGVVLDGNESGSGLINLGTRETFNSGNHENFISVYSSKARINRGRDVYIKAEVITSDSVAIGTSNFVTIESNFMQCLSC